MKASRLTFSALLMFGSIVLAGCGKNGGKDNPPPAPIDEKEFATITVINGTASGEYEIGSEVTITANAQEGKQFSYWSLNDQLVSMSNPYTFEVTGDETYVARYTNVVEKATVTVINGTGGGEYEIGSNVTVVANVASGKEFVNWTVEGEVVSSSATYTFTLEDDITLTANVRDANKMSQYTKNVTMTGDDFKILCLTDIQLHDGDTIDITKHIADTLVEREQPDMIVFLGDLLNDSTEYSTVEMPKKVVSLLDSYDIPWAPVFGNHDNDDYKPEGSKKYGGDEYLETLFAECDNCLYIHGPAEVQGSSNYIVNVLEEGSGKLVESLVFLDSYHSGLVQSNTKFYEDAIDYVKSLNNDVTPRSIVFDHVPITQYGDAYTAAENDELHILSGCPGRNPLFGGDGSLFPAIKELGSTNVVVSGHDHENSFFTDYEGVTLAFAMKSSEGDDIDGCSYSHPLGGLAITLDGKDENLQYSKVTDLSYEVKNGGDFAYHPEILHYWRYSGAKLNFDVELPESGTIKFNLEGTNFRRDVEEKLQKGSWNRLTENVVIDASAKSVNYGSLSLIEGNKYHYELDLTEIPLNLAGNEKAYGDETERIVYFNNATANFKVNDIHFEFEEITETNQIDLSQAVIAPIEDQAYQKGKVVRPDVNVKLNGQPLAKIDDILVKYSNEKELGTATVEVVPSGKGAHRYKGSKTATYNIVGNQWRGDAFEAGYTHELNNIPKTETLEFDVHFTSASDSTLWFFLGEGWDNYFGYYGLKADGTLVENYPGISVLPTDDEYFRVSCVISELVTKHASAIPQNCIDLFYIRDGWGNNPKGYIDFNTSEGPATVRGETFTGGENKTIDNFGTLTYSDTIIVDIKFTSTAGTHINFSVGNKAEDWSHYFGYYKLTSAGVIEGNSDGITITNTPDGYYRMTIVLRELTKASDGGAPSEELGFNLFYIRGGWSTGSGYIDFNPVK